MLVWPVYLLQLNHYSEDLFQQKNCLHFQETRLAYLPKLLRDFFLETSLVSKARSRRRCLTIRRYLVCLFVSLQPIQTFLFAGRQQVAVAAVGPRRCSSSIKDVSKMLKRKYFFAIPLSVNRRCGNLSLFLSLPLTSNVFVRSLRIYVVYLLLSVTRVNLFLLCTDKG